MNRLLTINRNTDSFHSVSFDAGLFIGLSTYFLFPSLILLVFAWAAMIILSSISVKDFLWSLIGFAFPYLVLVLIRLVFDLELTLFPESYVGELELNIDLNYIHYSIIVVCLFTIIYGLLVLNKKLKRSSVRFQRLVSALNMFFIVMGIFGFMISLLNDWRYVFLSLIFPIAYYWHCLGQTKSGLLLKTFLYLVWGGLIVFNFIGHTS